jgi:tRNA threonylcarbamoyl adenosine modification protein YeaZ
VLVLALDTSSAAVTAALTTVADGAELLAVRTTINARAHGELLAPSIEACLAEVGAAPRELDAIVAGAGPGPYTGLRVGLVTASALADALGIPAYAVCSLDAIAGALDAPRLLVAGDARRREVYWAGYVDGSRQGGGAPPQVGKAADVPVEDFTAMAGAGARLYADVLGLPLLEQDYPDPLALVRAAADRISSRAPGEILTPLYLRRPDAVEPGRPKAVRV